MGDQEREQAIKRMMIESRFMEAVQDAVYLCGIERHKLHQGSIPKLRELIIKIADEHDVQLNKLPDANKKEVLSITQNDLETLVEKSMSHLKEVFTSLKVTNFEETDEYKELEELVREIIDYEKRKRDEELKMDQEQE